MEITEKHQKILDQILTAAEDGLLGHVIVKCKDGKERTLVVAFALPDDPSLAMRMNPLAVVMDEDVKALIDMDDAADIYGKVPPMAMKILAEARSRLSVTSGSSGTVPLPV